jgi:hypothetical protein
LTSSPTGGRTEPDRMRFNQRLACHKHRVMELAHGRTHVLAGRTHGARARGGLGGACRGLPQEPPQHRPARGWQLPLWVPGMYSCQLGCLVGALGVELQCWPDSVHHGAERLFPSRSLFHGCVFHRLNARRVCMGLAGQPAPPTPLSFTNRVQWVGPQSAPAVRTRSPHPRARVHALSHSLSV